MAVHLFKAVGDDGPFKYDHYLARELQSLFKGERVPSVGDLVNQLNGADYTDGQACLLVGDHTFFVERI